MRLLGSAASPYVRKVRIVLAEKNIPCQFEEVDVMGPRSPAYEWNPLGKIPCLICSDGESVFDSRVICEYLDIQSADPLLIPARGPSRIDVLRWQALADGIMDAGILYRWELTQRAAQYRDPAWLERQKLKVTSGVHALANELQDKTYCSADGFTLADISVCCALEWLSFRLPEIEWPSRYPALAAFVSRMRERPSVIETSPRA